MRHETYREMLARRAELSPAEESALRGHLGHCAECRMLTEAYARQTVLLRALPEAVPPPELRAGVLDAIRLQPATPVPIWRRPTALLPLAAALLVAGIGLSTLHPHSGGQRTASGATFSTQTTSGPIFDGVAPKRGARPTSSSSVLRRTGRSSAHHAARPAATASGYTPVGTVAQNPPAPAVPPIVSQPIVPTPTPLPVAVHVAAGAPPAMAKQAKDGSAAARSAREAAPTHAPIAGGGSPPVAPAAPPKNSAPSVPANPSIGSAPTAPPLPSPVPFATPAAYAAPIPATVTASPTATPPPTPAPVAVPYAGPQATPTPTP